MRPLFALLEDVPVIGILRGCPLKHIVAMAGAALDEGIRVLEVTLDSPDAPAAIGALASIDRAFVGAGTVRTVEDVDVAVATRARFIVCPVTRRDVVQRCSDLGVPVLPGAATPTEIALAVEWGADAVKVFPAEQLGGPAFLRAVAGPLGHPPLVPTGGVEAANARAYLDAGAVAVGAGGSMFPGDALRSGDVDTVRKRASDLMAAIS